MPPPMAAPTQAHIAIVSHHRSRERVPQSNAPVPQSPPTRLNRPVPVEDLRRSHHIPDLVRLLLTASSTSRTRLTRKASVLEIPRTGPRPDWPHRSAIHPPDAGWLDGMEGFARVESSSSCNASSSRCNSPFPIPHSPFPIPVDRRGELPLRMTAASALGYCSFGAALGLLFSVGSPSPFICFAFALHLLCISFAFARHLLCAGCAHRNESRLTRPHSGAMQDARGMCGPAFRRPGHHSPIHAAMCRSHAKKMKRFPPPPPFPFPLVNHVGSFSRMKPGEFT